MKEVLVELVYDKLHIILIEKYIHVMSEECFEECEMIIFLWQKLKNDEKKLIKR